MAVPIYCVNLLLDTNFMFLMYAPDGNPLAWFRDHVGYHWIGFPVLLVAVFALMDVPIMLKKRKEDKLLSAAKPIYSASVTKCRAPKSEKPKPSPIVSTVSQKCST